MIKSFRFDIPVTTEVQLEKNSCNTVLEWSQLLCDARPEKQKEITKDPVEDLGK
jgi:hypothetical protein